MKLIKRLLSYIPSPLPLGVAEFEVWSASIIELLPTGMANIPFDDMKFVLSSAIMHLGQTKSYVPKSYFVRLAHKAAASQVAGQVFQDVKQKQLEQRQLESEKQQAEATAQAKVANSVETQADNAAGS